MGIFVSLGVKKLVSDYQSDCCGNSYKGAQSASEMSLILGSTSVALGTEPSIVFMAVISGPGRRYERRGNAEPCVDGLEKSSGLGWWSVACY